mmetsp:Transcript_24630/g.46747  ORF Transcript_24630/g.46747 Transcript_24630/m.46747 type:complete len:96 (-) Transcript_24630:446-733(-)
MLRRHVVLLGIRCSVVRGAAHIVVGLLPPDSLHLLRVNDYRAAEQPHRALMRILPGGAPRQQAGDGSAVNAMKAIITSTYNVGWSERGRRHKRCT